MIVQSHHAEKTWARLGRRGQTITGAAGRTGPSTQEPFRQYARYFARQGGHGSVRFLLEPPLYGSFSDSSCTFTYDDASVPVAGSAVAPGRIWGHIDCPDATDAVVEAADGSATSRTCDGYADFMFENCE
jgi:hypothetical protein